VRTKTKKPKAVPLFVELDPNLRRALEQLARDNHRTIAGETRIALENHTKNSLEKSIEKH
jgi:hypothetical protein